MSEDYKTLTAALIAGSLHVGEHGLALPGKPYGPRGYIDPETGAWRPNRLARREGRRRPLGRHPAARRGQLRTVNHQPVVEIDTAELELRLAALAVEGATIPIDVETSPLDQLHVIDQLRCDPLYYFLPQSARYTEEEARRIRETIACAAAVQGVRDVRYLAHAPSPVRFADPAPAPDVEDTLIQRAATPRPLYFRLPPPNPLPHEEYEYVRRMITRVLEANPVRHVYVPEPLRYVEIAIRHPWFPDPNVHPMEEVAGGD